MKAAMDINHGYSKIRLFPFLEKTIKLLLVTINSNQAILE
jgi:hypothetical protein